MTATTTLAVDALLLDIDGTLVNSDAAARSAGMRVVGVGPRAAAYGPDRARTRPRARTGRGRRRRHHHPAPQPRLSSR